MKKENNVLLFHTKSNNISEIFKKFNYVGLGHIHSTTNVNGNGKIRYTGSIVDFNNLNKLNSERVFTIIDTETFKISEIKYSIKEMSK